MQSNSATEYGLRRILVSAGVLLAVLLQTLDLTIVNVALPTIQGNLGAAVDEAAWIVIGYMIPAVVVIPLTPWLQTRFGRKRYFLTSIAGFTAASVLCGMSSSIEMLIAARVVQGLFGGGLLATAQTILRETFPAQQIGLSQSLYMMGIIIGPSLGPLLGGLITDGAAWPWIFFVNVVPGCAAFALLLVFLRDVASPRALPFDAAGVVLLALGSGSLEYVLEQGERWDWLSDPNIRIAVVLASAGIALFILRELTTRTPIVDLRLLRNRTVSAGILLMLVNTFTIYGQQFLMPQYLSQSLGFTATLSGETLVFRAIPIALLTISVGAIAGKRVPAWTLAAVGFAISGLGDVFLANVTTTQTPQADVAAALVFTGIGLALVNTPLMIAVIGAVTGPDIPKAAAFLNLFMQLGGSISSSVLITLVDRREAFHQAILAGGVTLARTPVLAAMHTTLAAIAVQVINQAYALGYADGFRFIGLLTLVFIPTTLLMLPKRAKSL